MAMMGAMNILKQQKLKKSLISLEMEQSYIFKESKGKQDRKLSPWYENKNGGRWKSANKLNRNDKCQQFLKKVLFKKTAIKRHHTQYVSGESLLKKQSFSHQKTIQNQDKPYSIVLFPKSKEKFHELYRGKQQKIVACLPGHLFSPKFQNHSKRIEESNRIIRKGIKINPYQRSYRKNHFRNQTENKKKQSSMTLKQMHQIIERESRKTDRTFSGEEKFLNQFRSERVYTESANQQWFISRHRKTKNRFTNKKSQSYACRTIFIN